MLNDKVGVYTCVVPLVIYSYFLLQQKKNKTWQVINNVI